MLRLSMHRGSLSFLDDLLHCLEELFVHVCLGLTYLARASRLCRKQRDFGIRFRLRVYNWVSVHWVVEGRVSELRLLMRKCQYVPRSSAT